MTHPAGEVGGGSDAPIVAAEPTIEDRLSAALGAPQDDDDPPTADDPNVPPPVADDADDLTPEDVPDDPAGEAGDNPEPIAPPVSWTGENKAKFAELPRDVQEYIAERETEREKFVQTKAQEAAKTRATVEQQAVEAFTNLQTQYAQNLQALLPQIPTRPTHQQIADDPWTYGPQMDAYESAVAQHQFVQQQLGQIAQQQQAAQQAQRNQLITESQALLNEKFPEYLDATEGPKLRAQLEPIASTLGYSLSDMDGKDILAIREFANLKAKADKYDALMAKKMEKVREAKNLPKVTRPGTAQAPGAAANARYQADRELMKTGDMDAAARAIARFI